VKIEAGFGSGEPLVVGGTFRGVLVVSRSAPERGGPPLLCSAGMMFGDPVDLLAPMD
jgi:hypothetical protein